MINLSRTIAIIFGHNPIYFIIYITPTIDIKSGTNNYVIMCSISTIIINVYYHQFVLSCIWPNYCYEYIWHPSYLNMYSTPTIIINM